MVTFQIKPTVGLTNVRLKLKLNLKTREVLLLSSKGTRLIIEKAIKRIKRGEDAY